MDLLTQAKRKGLTDDEIRAAQEAGRKRWDDRLLAIAEGPMVRRPGEAPIEIELAINNHRIAIGHPLAMDVDQFRVVIG